MEKKRGKQFAFFYTRDALGMCSFVCRWLKELVSLGPEELVPEFAVIVLAVLPCLGTQRPGGRCGCARWISGWVDGRVWAGG